MSCQSKTATKSCTLREQKHGWQKVNLFLYIDQKCPVVISHVWSLIYCRRAQPRSQLDFNLCNTRCLSSFDLTGKTDMHKHSCLDWTSLLWNLALEQDMPNLKCFLLSLRANVLYYFVYSVPWGGVCVCVVLALFLCNLVCCCTVKIRLWGLECGPWFNKAYLQRIWHWH